METELETVLSRENMLKAWQRVVENGGYAGVDRKSIQETDEHLKRLGVTGRALGVASCRRGAWRMARHVTVNQALKTKTLDRYGFSLPWQFAG